MTLVCQRISAHHATYCNKDHSNGEELVSLSLVKELMSQQRDLFMQLLQQQESNFKTVVELIVNNVNARIDKLTRETQELRSSLQFSQKNIDDLIKKNEKIELERRIACDETKTMQGKLAEMTEKADYLDGQTRRNNLVVDGIPEAQNESWKETEDKVSTTGNPSGYSGKRSRTIMIKFLRYKDKMAVLGKTKDLKGTNIYVNEDYTEAIRQKHKELIPDMKAARERGDIAYIRHDKLIVHPPAQKHKD
ncbi:protein unc-13 homolog C-like [Tachysurus ichikawai]